MEMGEKFKKNHTSGRVETTEKMQFTEIIGKFNICMIYFSSYMCSKPKCQLYIHSSTVIMFACTLCAICIFKILMAFYAFHSMQHFTPFWYRSHFGLTKKSQAILNGTVVLQHISFMHSTTVKLKLNYHKYCNHYRHSHGVRTCVCVHECDY